MRDQTFMTLMRLLPKSALSSAMGHASRLPLPAKVHQLAMRAFAQQYGVELDEAEHALEGYPNFSQFFARKLKPGLRPVDLGVNVIVSPVDGAVSQAGYLEEGGLLQAKGVRYPVERLLGEVEAARPFQKGAFATLYLSPRDYHRIHAPLAGTIEGYAYIPGEFWPVNPSSVRSKEALFCVNERLVTYLATAVGRCAVVKVGATCVSRIRASYDELMTHQGESGKTHRYPAPFAVEKGAELGWFEMGSTVILLFEEGRVRWDASLTPESKVRMGQRIGEAT